MSMVLVTIFGIVLLSVFNWFKPQHPAFRIGLFKSKIITLLIPLLGLLGISWVTFQVVYIKGLFYAIGFIVVIYFINLLSARYFYRQAVKELAESFMANSGTNVTLSKKAAYRTAEMEISQIVGRKSSKTT